MKRGILIIVIVCAVIALGFLIYSMVKKSEVEKQVAMGGFGEETLVMIDAGDYRISCNDAKAIASMITDINNDFVNNPELISSVSVDNMTPAMKRFETTMADFSRKIENRVADNGTAQQIVFEGIGEGVSNIFQVSIMSHLGMITPAQLDEYINVTYCGATPPAGYVSPLDMDIESVQMPGDNATSVSPDNVTEYHFDNSTALPSSEDRLPVTGGDNATVPGGM